jgi:hypothetical protein
VFEIQLSLDTSYGYPLLITCNWATVTEKPGQKTTGIIEPPPNQTRYDLLRTDLETIERYIGEQIEWWVLDKETADYTSYIPVSLHLKKC